MPLTDDRLIRIGKAHANVVLTWKEGISIERDSGSVVTQIQLEVASARWHLSDEMRRHADAQIRRRQPQLRSAISRYYYAMYHAIRAATYLFHGGDDHEAHNKLPQNVPTDFPQTAHWSNQLKNAREYRNNADYDPYPQATQHWKAIAVILQADASQLLPVAKAYLITKGCAL